MRFKAQETVRGISNMDYVIDGEKVLSLAVHVDVALDPKAGGKGYRTEPMRADSKEVVTAIQHNPFPFLAELDIEQRAGKKQGSVNLVIVGIRPIETVKKAA